MSKKIIRLTESEFNDLISRTVNTILKEDFQITLNNKGNEGFNNLKMWTMARQELTQKGQTIIHIPLSYDKIFDATVSLTDRNTYLVELNYGKNKELASINDAFLYIKNVAQDLLNN